MAWALAPLSAVSAAISYAVYKRAKNASASVPERYIKVASIFPEEFDDVTRPTDIYLLFVSLENMELLGSFKSLQHWAVGCDFGNRASIYELTGDPIKPCWIQWNMADCTEKFTHVIKLGTADISPKRVRDMAEQNVYNNTKYQVIGNNCQDWVEWLLCEIDPELARAMYERGVRKVSETFLGHIAKRNKSWTDGLPSSLGSSASKGNNSTLVPRYQRVGRQIKIHYQQ